RLWARAAEPGHDVGLGVAAGPLVADCGDYIPGPLRDDRDAVVLWEREGPVEVGRARRARDAPGQGAIQAPVGREPGQRGVRADPTSDRDPPSAGEGEGRGRAASRADPKPAPIPERRVQAAVQEQSGHEET